MLSGCHSRREPLFNGVLVSAYLAVPKVPSSSDDSVGLALQNILYISWMKVLVFCIGLLGFVNHTLYKNKNHADACLINPHIDTVAYLANPRVVVYNDENGDYVLRCWKAFETIDTFIYSNLLNLISLELDTATFDEGKQPLVIFKWRLAKEHSYGGHGSWTARTDEVLIWDITRIEEVFSVVTYDEHSDLWIDFDEDGSAVTETDTDCFFKIDFNLNKKEKIIMLDSMETNCDTLALPGNYIYREGEFVQL